MARNFKSTGAYNKWLAYGHASGAFKRSPGHQKVKIQGKDKKVKHAGGGYRSRYAAGGMYSDNTVQSAAQGLNASTSNIVYQETGSGLQDKRIESMKDEQERLAQASLLAEQEVKDIKQQGEVDAAAEAQKVQQQFALGEMSAGSLLKAADVESPKDIKGKALGTALQAYKGTRAANLGLQATAGNVGGLNLITDTAKAAKAVKALPEGARIMSSAATGKTIVVDAGGNIIKGGSAVGAGMKSFLSSGAGIGTLATLAGAGLKKWAADDDPTTADWGDVGGSALSAAGTGMALGSMFGPVGTLVGGVGGALYGAGKAVFGARKAKRVQRRWKRKERKRIRKHNLALKKGFGTQFSQIRGGELAGKTYSGYDYGKNIAAKLGGMRMGIPRYGYSA